MSHIGSGDTKPELFVRKLLFSAGFRYRIHCSSMPGKPDLVLKKYRTVIFIHGCFWHGHAGCSKSSLPKTNSAFWQTKISQNIERDRKVNETLLSRGWRVLVIWQCACKRSRADALLTEITDFLASDSKFREIG